MNGIVAPMQETDRSLIRNHLAGDREAFDQLVVKYHPLIYRFLYRMVGTREVAEDLAQETFLRAYRAAASYKPRYRFTTWLYTIAKNLARNELRRRGRDVQVYSMGSLKDLVGLDGPTGQAGPDELASLSEEGQRVHQILQGMNENLRTALILAYYHGRSYQEISEILHRPRGTIKSWVFRAKRQILKRVRDTEKMG